jgi:molecular chaperone GrpE (heat shock protein)
MDEIEQLKQKILQLENIKKQKEIEEENLKKQSFEYYFQQLFDIIQMSKKKYTYMSSEDYIRARQGNKCVEGVNENLVPVLESIYSSLNIINKRLLKLENK